MIAVGGLHTTVVDVGGQDGGLDGLQVEALAPSNLTTARCRATTQSAHLAETTHILRVRNRSATCTMESLARFPCELWGQFGSRAARGADPLSHGWSLFP